MTLCGVECLLNIFPAPCSTPLLGGVDHSAVIYSEEILKRIKSKADFIMSPFISMDPSLN